MQPVREVLPLVQEGCGLCPGALEPLRLCGRGRGLRRRHAPVSCVERGTGMYNKVYRVELAGSERGVAGRAGGRPPGAARLRDGCIGGGMKNWVYVPSGCPGAG
jgi:hypothetical protein